MLFQHNYFYLFVSFLIALFPVINPIGNGFIVNGFLEELDNRQRKFAIKKIVFNCFLLSIGTLIAGHFILLLFGLAVPVIQVGGGIIICKTGWDWLSDSKKVKTEHMHDITGKINMSEIGKQLFYPLSFPISIGPGTISVIFTLMATASVEGDFLRTGINYALLVLAIAAMLALFYFFLLESPEITKRLGDSGSLIINKLVAFITFCVGIQIIFNGIAKIFHLTIL